MKYQEHRLFLGFVAVDVLVNAATFIGAAEIIYTEYQDLSFSGFMGLFVLLLLVPYYFATALILFLLIFGGLKEELKLLLVPFLLQSMAPILWLLFTSALKSLGWFEASMTLQSVAGIFGIFLWFVVWTVERKKNHKRY